MSSPGSCRAACTSISTIVYAYCRWADDLGDEISDPQKALSLLDEWEQELRDCYAGEPAHPVFIALRAHRDRARHSRGAVFRSACRLPPGPDGAPLRVLERCVSLLPLLGESGRPSGAVPVRLSRRGAPAAFRRHLHGTAARQFLAGRVARPRKGPHLHSARTPSRRTALPKTISSGAASTRATSRS